MGGPSKEKHMETNIPKAHRKNIIHMKGTQYLSDGCSPSKENTPTWKALKGRNIITIGATHRKALKGRNPSAMGAAHLKESAPT
jgi:hypothetical protein